MSGDVPTKRGRDVNQSVSLPISLAELNLPPVARSIIKEALADAAGAGVPLIDASTAGYVSLAPGPNHTVAVYVHRDRLSVALDQDAARHIVGEHPRLTLDARNGPVAAGYVVGTYEAIDRNALRDVVVKLIHDAVVRSSTIGPRSYGKRGAREHLPAPAQFCPNHPGIALPRSGLCDLCA